MSIRVHSRNAAAAGALGLLFGTSDGADASADGEDDAIVRGAGLGVVDAEGPHAATAIARLIRAATGRAVLTVPSLCLSRRPNRRPPQSWGCAGARVRWPHPRASCGPSLGPRAASRDQRLSPEHSSLEAIRPQRSRRWPRETAQTTRTTRPTTTIIPPSPHRSHADPDQSPYPDIIWHLCFTPLREPGRARRATFRLPADPLGRHKDRQSKRRSVDVHHLGCRRCWPPGERAGGRHRIGTHRPIVAPGRQDDRIHRIGRRVAAFGRPWGFEDNEVDCRRGRALWCGWQGRDRLPSCHGAGAGFV
jgi:hypothetical protein